MVHRSHEFHKLQRRCDSKRKGVARNCHSAASRLQIRHSCVRWRSDNESHENNFPQKAFCLRRADKLRLIDSQSGWGSVRSLDQWTPSRYQAGRLNITDRESCRSLRGSETGPSEDCFRFFLPPPPPRSLVRLWPASPIRVGEGSHVGWCCKSCTARHDRVLRVSERPRRRAIVWRCFASYNWQLSTGDHDAYQSVGWSSNYSAVQSECGRFRQRWVKFIGAPRHASFIDAMLRGQAVTPSGKMQVGLILIMLSVAIALTDAASIGHARGKADCKRWVKGKRGRCATPIDLVACFFRGRNQVPRLFRTRRAKLLAQKLWLFLPSLRSRLLFSYPIVGTDRRQFQSCVSFARVSLCVRGMINLDWLEAWELHRSCWKNLSLVVQYSFIISSFVGLVYLTVA